MEYSICNNYLDLGCGERHDDHSSNSHFHGGQGHPLCVVASTACTQSDSAAAATVNIIQSSSTRAAERFGKNNHTVQLRADSGTSWTPYVSVSTDQMGGDRKITRKNDHVRSHECWTAVHNIGAAIPLNPV